jgi:hypothetical protein
MKHVALYCLCIFTVLLQLAGISPTRSQAQPDLDKQLIDAIQTQNAGSVIDLLKRGASPNAQYATIWFNIDAPEPIVTSALVVSLGWKPPFSGCLESIVVARRKKHVADVAIVRALCQAGASIPDTEDIDENPILQATRHCDLDVFKLVWARRDTAASARIHYLPYAAAALRPDVVDFLLGETSDVNQRDGKGKTALLAVVAAGSLFPEDDGNQVAIAEDLLRHGAQVNLQDKDGMTALMWAAAHRNEKLVRLLLKYKAATNIRDNGLKVVHINGTMVSLRGADAGGRTALDWANGEPTIVKLLKSASARRANAPPQRTEFVGNVNPTTGYRCRFDVPFRWKFKDERGETFAPTCLDGGTFTVPGSLNKSAVEARLLGPSLPPKAPIIVSFLSSRSGALLSGMRLKAGYPEYNYLDSTIPSHIQHFGMDGSAATMITKKGKHSFKITLMLYNSDCPAFYEMTTEGEMLDYKRITDEIALVIASFRIDKATVSGPGR